MICETKQSAQVKPFCNSNSECDVLPRREKPFPSQCGSVKKIPLLTKRCQLRKLHKAGPLDVFDLNAGRVRWARVYSRKGTKGPCFDRPEFILVRNASEIEQLRRIRLRR